MGGRVNEKLTSYLRKDKQRELDFLVTKVKVGIYCTITFFSFGYKVYEYDLLS